MTVLKPRDNNWAVSGMIPRLFAVLAMLGGAAYVVLIPPLQVPDETFHFYRAYAVSRGEWVARPLAPLPNRIRELEYWFEPRPNIDAGNVEQLRPEKILPLFHIPFSETDQGYTTNINQNVYSPVPYFATGLAMAVGRKFHPSAIALMYFGRFCNLIAFVCVIYTALRILPAFRVVFFALALMPMTLALASSFSADAQTNSLAFLLFAYILRLSLDDGIKTLQRRHYVILAALIFLNALCKADAILALLVLMIPRDKMALKWSRWRWLAPAAFIALAVAVAGVWNYLSRENHTAYALARMQAGIDIEANLRFIYAHPVLWCQAFLRTLQTQWHFYLQLFVGTLGYYAVWLPNWLVLGYPIFLAAAAASQPAPIGLTLWQKTVLLTAALVSAAAVFVLLWDHETSAALLHTVAGGRDSFPSLAGRYFIPFAPALLIVLANRRVRIPAAAVVVLAIALVCVSNVFGALRTWKTYYELSPDRTSDLTVAHVASQVGTFRQGIWILDSDGSRSVDYSGNDAIFAFGGIPGDLPVFGDWNGDGITEIGIYRKGVWYLDYNGNGRLDADLAGEDSVCRLGGMDGDIPVVGDWTGAGKSRIGIFRHGVWLLDATGECVNRRGTVDQPVVRSFGGEEGDIPVVGDWEGNGRAHLGVFRKGGRWILDSNGNGALDAGDRSFVFGGILEDMPVVGDWNGDGRSDVGIYRGGVWILHGTGCGGASSECAFPFGGLPGDRPVVGRWRVRTRTFEGKLVRRPGSTFEDGKVYLVRGGRRHWVRRAAWISSHGDKWPDDVVVIRPEELERIPMGDPIQ